MGKIIQLLLLLSCITALTYALPFPSDDSDESSGSSSSSEESKKHPYIPQVLTGNSQPTSTYPNTPNRSRRDTVHTNGHQGGPDESPHPKVIQPPQAPNNGNQNRQTRDTAGHTNGHQGGPDESPYPKVIQPPQTPNNGNQNRPTRDTDSQQTPAKIFDSNPTSSSSTEQPDRYSVLNRNAQTDQSRYNRQVRDYEQQPPVLSSNPNSPSSTEKTDDTNFKTQSTNTAGYQNRQVRGADDLQVPRLLLSTSSPTSTETDIEGSTPTISSTQIPGDVYGENLRKTDEASVKRDTSNQDNIPRVIASNANDQGSQKPNLSETSSEKSENGDDSDQVKVVKLDGSNPYGRFQQ